MINLSNWQTLFVLKWINDVVHINDIVHIFLLWFTILQNIKHTLVSCWSWIGEILKSTQLNWSLSSRFHLNQTNSDLKYLRDIKMLLKIQLLWYLIGNYFKLLRFQLVQLTIVELTINELCIELSWKAIGKQTLVLSFDHF